MPADSRGANVIERIIMKNVMTLENALKKAAVLMDDMAKHAAIDLGEKKYSVELHAEAAGYAMRVLFHPKGVKTDADGNAVNVLEPTTANFASLFHGLYNHSHWRQKFERAGYFAKTEKNPYAAGRFDEEGGE